MLVIVLHDISNDIGVDAKRICPNLLSCGTLLLSCITWNGYVDILAIRTCWVLLVRQ